MLLFIAALTFSLSITAFAEDNAEAEFAENEDAGEENVFTEIYDTFRDNSDKIFSLLAFISSLLIAFSYKKGLIPIVNKGLLAIKKSSEAFEDASKKTLEKNEENLSFLNEKFVSVANCLEALSEYVDTLDEKLEAVKCTKDDSENIKKVMLSQIDMLYEIFMNSALPQYSKDAVGEKIAEMKKSVSAGV